ncbi:Signal transduction histidine kinase [Thermomonospora echinospora]|uniref:histidine kinase n=1 Tax=Thermomonospora echinospora TaxID=1992 RepID=A0A1H5WBW0_9ACTN|nr:sensor histidine kinase [Thermomonospora echinospora]SEF96945.1 Signal transduction histidine kinase [Thermomonospora echinospora]
MTSDNSDSRPPFGQEIAQYAWRLSGRLVAGLGQLLLWIITGLGRLLRPLVLRAGAGLFGMFRRGTGRQAPAPGHPGMPYPGPGSDGRTRIVPGGPAAMAQTAPMPRWVGFWREFAGSWYYAPLTGAALVVAALAELAPQGVPPVSVAGGFAVAATLPLVWRREFLRPVAAVVLSAFAAGLLSGQPLLFTTAFAALYTLYELGRHLPRQSAGALAVGASATVGVVYLAAETLDDIPWPAALVAVLAAIGLGDARRVVESAERTEAEAAERTSETLTRLTAVQREQAVMRERARIARELHDVVAHSVSMIAVQAETAPYTMDDLSPQAREGYLEIARTAREALVEMRRLLGVLRADAGTGPPESAPQPRLDRLPELIEQHRGAGGQAELQVRGDPRALSTTVELSAYRIVQEALTNARRHAPGAEVQVELAYLNDRLAVRVRDTGANAPTMVLDPSEAGGHGLVGMRERATMLGGRFSAGPASEGGFMVEAELPFAREETPRSDAHPAHPARSARSARSPGRHDRR